MKIELSPDTSEVITVGVLKGMYKTFPELREHINEILAYIMKHSEYTEWSRGIRRDQSRTD